MKVGILVTGGMDSTALLYEAANDEDTIVYPISIDYGQAAFSIQRSLVNWHCEYLQSLDLEVKPVRYIPVTFHPFQRYSEALFDPNYKCDEERPLAEWDQMRYKKSLIEGRNALMVLYALGYCASEKIDELWAGYLYGQEEWEKRFTVKMLLGDNSPQFVDTINILALMGFSHSVRFRAPFYERRLEKADVYEIGKEYNVDYVKTYSCYFPVPCHKCDNCLLRDQILGHI